MAHKVGKKLINTNEIMLLPTKVLEWKIQEHGFFLAHCLSKRDYKNDSVLRFKVDILLEISEVSTMALEQNDKGRKTGKTKPSISIPGT